ncbi:MAG: alkaline phosphatase family protein [Planctomycetota bacterium]
MRRAALPGLLAVAAGGAAGAGMPPQGKPARVERVILVSIDGLRPEFYRDETYEAPVLRELARRGAWAKGVEGVFPSVTYPSHASIATGVRPWKHGIYANTVWTERGSTRDWHWYARDLRARTLWDAAREKGIPAAITYWPVSVGARADWVLGEIWDPEGRETAARLQGAATPGLLLELCLALGVPRERIAQDKAAIDAFVSGAAAYVFRRYRPALQFVHLLQVDDVQHKEGRDGPGVREAVRRQDAQVGRILRAVREAGEEERTVFVVTGDYGFLDVRRQVHPNAVLREAGFLEVEGGELRSWKALVRSSGGSAAVYVKDPADVPRVAEAFRRAAVRDGERLYTVLERAELEALGYNPEAALALEPADGWAISGSLTGALVEGTPSVKANHGQRPDRRELHTGFVAAGPGIRPGTVIERMRLIDIAPTVARWLGLEMEGVEGEAIPALGR